MIDEIAFQCLAGIFVLLIVFLLSSLIKGYSFIGKVWRLPSLQPHHFLVGNLIAFWQNRADMAKYLITAAFRMREPGFFIVWVSYYPIVFIVSWKHNKKILGSKKFLNRGWPAKKLCRGFRGLIGLSDAEWKARRNFVAPSYVPSVLEGFIPTVVHHTQAMLDDFSGYKDIVDCLPILKYHVMFITFETSLGLKNSDESFRMAAIESSTNFLDSQFDRFHRFYTWTETTLRIYNWIYGIKDERETVREYARQVISERIEEKNRDVNENGIYSSDTPKKRNQAFLDNMLDNFKDGRAVSMEGLEDLIGELLTITATSYETIVNSTMWFLHNMAHNPVIQEKLYEELLGFDEKNENMTISQINELAYLDQCVYENLRLHPPVANMYRLLDEDVELDGHIIPKGILSSTFIYSIHHDEEIYPDPDKFDPSRFEPENFSKIPPGAYIPFGDGPRRCIGERLAILESKIIFTNIIKRFRIEPADEKQARVQIDLLTRPMKPLKFRFIERQR